MMMGWSNYFCLGPASKAYQAIDRHACYRLRRWLRFKHKVPGKGFGRFPTEILYGSYGLLRLPERTKSFSWANS